MDENAEYFEAEIIDERTTKGGKKRYKVRCIGYSLNEVQWVKEEDVSPKTMKEYVTRHAKRRRQVVTTVLESKWAGSFLAMTMASGASDETTSEVIRSTESTPFRYKPNLPRKG